MQAKKFMLADASGQTIFVGTSGGMLFGIDRTSLEVTHRWRFPQRLTNGVVYGDGLLYVYTYDNKLWAMELPIVRPATHSCAN